MLDPPEHRAFLPSPLGGSSAAGETTPVGNSDFLEANFWQGQGLSWGRAIRNRQSWVSHTQDGLFSLGLVGVVQVLRRLNILLPLARSLCSKRSGTQGLPQLQSQRVISQI